MPNIFQRARKSLFQVWQRKNLTKWNHLPATTMPIYGIYHIYCDTNWEELVTEQIAHLKSSGLLEYTDKLYVSCIVGKDSDVAKIKEILDSDKVEIVSVSLNPKCYEFPALDYMYEKSQKEDFLFYYFHTKGITYQCFHSDNKEFLKFREKIMSWRKMMEYFLFDKWKVAANTLLEGYETYGSYLYPPFKNIMYAGNFWWTRASYFRKLDRLTEETKRNNRFMAEEWLLTKSTNPFCAFDTVANLYFVNIKPTIYEDGKFSLWDSISFFLVYTFRKYQSKWFGYSYKKHCQTEFQKLKSKI